MRAFPLLTATTAFIAALAASARPVAAQAADPNTVKHRNDCRLAAQVLATGEPAPRAAWARRYIVSCGSGTGPARARAFDRLRASRDTAELFPLLAAALYVRDGALFARALAVATDPTASMEARVTGLLTAGTQIEPQAAVDRTALFAPGDNTDCPLGWYSSPLPRAPGAALPADAAAQLRQLAAVDDGAAPAPLRRAAACARRVAATIPR